MAWMTNIQLTTPGQLDVDIVTNNVKPISNDYSSYNFINKIINDEIIAE